MREKEASAAYFSFAHLMALLDQGWQIEPPIYVRPRWSSRARAGRLRWTYPRLDKENTYHFVLRQGNRFNLISVFDCPEVQQLLESEQLAVDRI